MQGLSSENSKQITKLDLKKGVILYGNNGFEKLPQQIPEWIRTIFIYYDECKTNNLELINII